MSDQVLDMERIADDKQIDGEQPIVIRLPDILLVPLDDIGLSCWMLHQAAHIWPSLERNLDAEHPDGGATFEDLDGRFERIGDFVCLSVAGQKQVGDDDRQLVAGRALGGGYIVLTDLLECKVEPAHLDE